MDSDIISLREFARRIGIGEKTIRDSITSGKLKGCVTFIEGKPKIVYSKGVIEAKNAGIGSRILANNKTKKSGITAKTLDRHFALQKNQPKKLMSDKDEEDESEVDDSTLSYASALRVKENWNAKIKELEYLEKNETLVNKADVYTQLFDFGKEIRSEFESLPGRISSKIVSLGNDVSEVEKLLANEVRNSLSKLVDNMESRKIN